MLPRERITPDPSESGSVAFDAPLPEQVTGDTTGSSGLGLSLDALAIEGLTMGPARHHRAFADLDELELPPRLGREPSRGHPERNA